MTDKEIIKGLYYHINQSRCCGCPYHPEEDCTNALIVDAFGLINRKLAEIEKLKEENTILSQNADTAFQDGLNESQDLYAEQIKGKVKAEAVKEVLEKLEKRIFPYGMVNDGNYGINALSIKMTIEKVKKEMGGDAE